MKKGKWIIRVGIALAVSSLSAVAAGEQRYISIRNTDSVWVPGGICALQFRLDNGGSGQGFNNLALTLRIKNKQGETLEEGVMEVEPFGDSDATRTQQAYLDAPCHDDATSVEVINASETSDGKEINLPLSIFDAQYYQPLTVSIK
ncbi:IrmA family protein [Pantoea eucrina]|uniref:IrmA family protein n=1 Tax=Pantoea eucrina TaxID=472693 RepID=A0ABU5LGV3_9GAMM|nr:IrmA family protein [Pantoea eucrina]MDZ7279157.1 IrmA family protein [Pantoea eucrina]